MSIFFSAWRRQLAALAVTVMVLASVPLAPALAAGENVMVFAAASLTDVLTSIARQYESDTGTHIVMSFAGSSTLARQIEAGASADIFISADEAWMDELANRSLIKPDSRSDLLTNRLVLIAPLASASHLKIAPGFDLLAALEGGRLAVADPASVPAGRYARSALTSLGVWSGLVDHLAQAENVRIALAYVARAETPFGIVYQTDALSERKVRIVDTFPAISHLPITYPLALTKSAGREASAFLDYLHGPQATAMFVSAGFTIPHEKN